VLAAIRLDFDPSTTVFGLSIRLETLALAGVIFLVVLLAALASGRSRVSVSPADGVAVAEMPKLRRDDLILMAFGAVPGAVVGGRLGYALVHLDYYRAYPKAITDPGQGGFDLTLGVVVGTLTAIAVARLLAAPVGRWLSVASIPVLLGLGLGKLTMVLGGAGQGSYSGASWATSYAGSGPWGSLNPNYPAAPSQAIEGCLVLAVAILVLFVPFALRLQVRRWWRVVYPGLAPRRQWSALTGGRRYMTVSVYGPSSVSLRRSRGAMLAYWARSGRSADPAAGRRGGPGRAGGPGGVPSSARRVAPLAVTRRQEGRAGG